RPSCSDPSAPRSRCWCGRRLSSNAATWRSRMSDDPVADILGRLDRPVHPLADFGERLLASLVEGHLQSPRRTRVLAAARLLVRPRVMVAVLSVAAIVAALVMFGRHVSLRVTTHPVAPVGPTPVAPNSGTTNGDGTGAPSTPGGSVTESGAAP